MSFANNHGTRIHYEVEGKGTPLVLQHGFGSDLQTWRERGYTDALNHDHKLVLIDARGHGLSDKPHDPKMYDLKLRAGDIVSVLDELGIRRAHYFGYSMGGRIGFAMAKYAPERVFTLILGGIHPYQNPTNGRDRRLQLFEKGMQAYVDYLETQSPVSPERKARLLASDAEAYIAATVASKDAPSFEELLPRMAMPCLIFAGEADDVYARAKQGASEIPNATFVSFPNLNHLQTIAASNLVLPHVERFLEEQSAMEGVEHARTP